MSPPEALCPVESIPAEGAIEIIREDMRLILVRWHDQVRAYTNRCPHARLPLNWQPDDFLSYDRLYLQCSMHGALFDPLSGLCLAGPCRGRKLESIPVRIEQDKVWLVAGEE